MHVVDLWYWITIHFRQTPKLKCVSVIKRNKPFENNLFSDKKAYPFIKPHYFHNTPIMDLKCIILAPKVNAKRRSVHFILAYERLSRPFSEKVFGERIN